MCAAPRRPLRRFVARCSSATQSLAAPPARRLTERAESGATAVVLHLSDDLALRSCSMISAYDLSMGAPRGRRIAAQSGADRIGTERSFVPRCPFCRRRVVVAAVSAPTTMSSRSCALCCAVAVRAAHSRSVGRSVGERGGGGMRSCAARLLAPIKTQSRPKCLFSSPLARAAGWLAGWLARPSPRRAESALLRTSRVDASRA